MIIQSKKVWVLGNWLEAQIEIEEGKIKAILPYDAKKADKDYGEKRIVPGFIDIHTHGAYGFDTNDAEEEGLRNWMKNIPQEGVTGILPTTITQSEEVLTKAVANVAKVVEEGYEGAEILGIHFEGPYLDMKYKGAQPEHCRSERQVGDGGAAPCKGIPQGRGPQGPGAGDQRPTAPTEAGAPM